MIVNRTETHEVDFDTRTRRGMQAYYSPMPRRSPNYVLFSIFADLLGTLGALFVADTVVRLGVAGSVSHLNPVLILLTLASFSGVFSLMRIYEAGHNMGLMQENKRVFLSTGLAMLVLMGTLYLSYITLPRTLIVGLFVSTLGSLLGWRLVANARFYLKALRAHIKPRRVLIVGANTMGKQVAEIILRSPWSGLEVTGYIDDSRSIDPDGIAVAGKFADVRRLVETGNIEEVVIALPSGQSAQIHQLVRDLYDLPVQVRVVPVYLNLALYRATVDDLGGLPLINLRDTALTPSQRLVKRAFDLIVASLVLLATMPVMLVIAVAIRLDSEGPVFFKQVRIGENGKPFRMFKFRSMIINAEAMQDEVTETDIDGNTIHKKRGDKRITRVGHFVRRTSLDELPQFINVMRGDMSLVGPRPELPWLVDEYEPWQRQRFSVPQGIIGWWQINGRSDKPCHLSTEEDLYYIKHYSLLLDVKILLRTVPAVLSGKGAF